MIMQTKVERDEMKERTFERPSEPVDLMEDRLDFRRCDCQDGKTVSLK